MRNLIPDQLSFRRQVQSLIDKHIREVSSSSLIAEPLVSVALVTYNQARFIEQAVLSILEQETRFAFELVISDDFSTDGTRDILLDYQKRYPDKIRLILADRNLWKAIPGLETSPTCNIAILSACRGKYVALLEGDDYWTDPYKLQKQVSALDSDRSCVMCFHSAKVMHEESRLDYCMNAGVGQSHFDLHDILSREWFIPSASMVFRNVISPLPEWITEMLSGDQCLHLLLADKGRFLFLDEVMCVYRKHQDGMSVRLVPDYWTKVIPSWIFMYSRFNRYFENRYDEDFRCRIDVLTLRLLRKHLEESFANVRHCRITTVASVVTEISDLFTRINPESSFRHVQHLAGRALLEMGDSLLRRDCRMARELYRISLLNSWSLIATLKYGAASVGTVIFSLGGRLKRYLH